MSRGNFEILPAEEMRRKYGLTRGNRPTILLDAKKVPDNLRPLIPYAELWGIGDDLIREDVVSDAPPEAKAELKHIVEAHDDLLDAWLAGPEASGPEFSAEYLAFSAMRMAADSM